MTTDVESAIDESMNHEERAVRALESMGQSFESMAEVLTSWVKLEQQRFEKEYPVRVPRDAVVTHVPNEEDKAREGLGSTNESLDEWQHLGPREQEVIAKQKKK